MYSRIFLSSLGPSTEMIKVSNVSLGASSCYDSCCPSAQDCTLDILTHLPELYMRVLEACMPHKSNCDSMSDVSNWANTQILCQGLRPDYMQIDYSCITRPNEQKNLQKVESEDSKPQGLLCLTCF